MRRAQITISIVVGILLLLVFFAMFGFSALNKKQIDLLSPEGAAAACLNIATESALQRLGRQTIIPLQKPIEEFQVSAAADSALLLPSLELIQQNLGPVINRFFLECLQKSSYDLGYEVLNGDVMPKSSIIFTPQALKLNLDYPVKLKQGNSVSTLNTLATSRNSNYRLIHRSMQELIQTYLETGYISSSPLTLIVDVSVEQSLTKNNEMVLFFIDSAHKTSSPVNYTFILR